MVVWRKTDELPLNNAYFVNNCGNSSCYANNFISSESDHICFQTQEGKDQKGKEKPFYWYLHTYSYSGFCPRVYTNVWQAIIFHNYCGGGIRKPEAS
ncbi:hypothetical protein IKF02_00480 [Candidatus Saccharibacteria bacterium]|nr:hypothetical protein [Candidatus Saccharibacteria bacterium]